MASLRQRAGLTQEALATRLGTVPTVVSRMERGQSAPSMERLAEIANVLGVDARDLLDFDDQTGGAEGGREAAIARIGALLRRRPPEDAELIADVTERVLKRLRER